MKKVLLAITLVLAMLLTLASCDGITGAFGSILGNKDVEAPVENDMSNATAARPGEEEAEDDAEEEDDPEANISGILSSVNDGLELGSLIEADMEETVDYEKMIEELRQAVKDVAFNKNYTVTAMQSGDEATVTGNASLQNGVFKISGDQMDDAYVFIEDDFKIVTVSVDGEDGSCYADVEGSLYEYFEQLQNVTESEAEVDEETQKMMQFFEKVLEITLPEASRKDVTYNEDDGRYYLSDEYTEKAIHEVAKKILEDYYEIYPEETPEDIYEGLEEGIAETLELLNLKIWLNARNESVTGFGFTFDVEDESLKKEENIGRISGAVDVTSNRMTIDVAVEGTEDYEASCTLKATVAYTKNSLEASGEFKLESEDASAIMKGSCKIDKTSASAELYVKTDTGVESDNVELSLKASIAADKDGMLEKAAFECNYIGAYTNSVSDHDDNGNYKYVRVEGTQNVSIDFALDLSNIEKGGTVASLDMHMTAEDIEAYVEKYDEYGYYDGYVYSEKYTQKYAGMKEETIVSAEIVSSNSGDKITAKASTEISTLGSEETNKVSITAVLDDAGNANIYVPYEVEEARQEALDDYGAEEPAYGYDDYGY